MSPEMAAEIAESMDLEQMAEGEARCSYGKDEVQCEHAAEWLVRVLCCPGLLCDGHRREFERASRSRLYVCGNHGVPLRITAEIPI